MSNLSKWEETNTVPIDVVGLGATPAFSRAHKAWFARQAIGAGATRILRYPAMAQAPAVQRQVTRTERIDAETIMSAGMGASAPIEYERNEQPRIVAGHRDPEREGSSIMNFFGLGAAAPDAKTMSLSTRLLISTGALFAGGAAGGFIGGKEHRIAGILIGAVSGTALANLGIVLATDKPAASP